MRRRRPLAGFLLTALLAAGGCSSASEGETSDGPEEGRPVRSELLLRTTASCHGAERSEAVLRDRASWQRWWAEVHCGEGEAPEVDFETEMVLALRDKQGPSGCYRLRVAKVETGVGGGYRVLAHRHVPKRSTPCTMVIVHSAEALSVPAVSGPVDFDWLTVQGPPPESAP